MWTLFQSTFILRRPGVTIFADIIQIVIMFMKTIFKNWKDFKRIRNYVPRWNLYMYFLISGENMLMADVSITQGVCHVIHIFFGSSLAKVELPSFIIVGYVWQILGRGFLIPHPPLFPIREQPLKVPSWIGLRAVRESCSSFSVKSQPTT